MSSLSSANIMGGKTTTNKQTKKQKQKRKNKTKQNKHTYKQTNYTL